MINRFIYSAAYLWCIALLTGCSHEHLAVQTQYLNRDNLASYRVRTPDPMLFAPLIGQRLIVDWVLPKNYFDQNPLYLQATIHFGNRTVAVDTVEIHQRKGTYIYQIIDGDFCEKQGMLAFKIDLIKGDCVIEEWRHQLWAELITVGAADVDKDSCERKVHSGL